MSNDEIVGRLAVLEVFAMTAFGVSLSNANDPAALLDSTRAAVSSLATALPPLAQSAAHQYADHLIATLRGNLPSLQGEGGGESH
jgi:hypothetical protein